MELILFYITAPLCVALLIHVIIRHESTGCLHSQIQALTRENTELREKLKKEAEDSSHIFRQLAANYDQRVDGEQNKIENIKLSHDSWREMAIYCVRSLNRFKPGWLDDRIAGKPEYEFVFTPPPQKRPLPPPKAAGIEKAKDTPSATL